MILVGPFQLRCPMIQGILQLSLCEDVLTVHVNCIVL